ncbi:MAG: carboxypeptidase-like regulatory domain-containing protein [Planctomycetota bacterium]
MNTRNLAILAATLALGVAAGLMLLGRDTMATALPGTADGDPAPFAPPIAADKQDAPSVAEGVYRPSGGAAAATPAPAQAAADRVDETRGWTSGVIRGDVQLAVAALDRLGSISVHIEEIRSSDGKPFRKIQRVERGNGTPTFEVRDIPFSDFPYRVYVRAAGLNGGQRTLAINAETPLHDVVLSITPGAPFSVLLRDQDGGAHAGIDVQMVPIGKPLGRPGRRGRSDNFGSLVFEDVLAGNYELIAALSGQPFGTPEQVTVQPGTRNFGRKVQGQGHTMVVARGVELNIAVHDGAGYAIAGCKITALATDRRLATEFEGISDPLGRVRFPHLKPGRWQLTIEHENYRRTDQQVVLKPDQLPLSKQIRLVPKRR